MTLAAIKRKAVGKALLRAEGNIAVAARELAVSRQSIYKYAREYGWLDSGGRIDPNLVADGRRCQNYWQLPSLRDTASNRAKNFKRRGQVNRERMPVDMNAIRGGNFEPLESH